MKKRKWLLPSLLVLALLAGLLWFTRPMTLETLFPGFDPGDVSQIDGTYSLISISDGSPFIKTWTVTDLSLDREVQDLFQDLCDAQFRRDLPDQFYAAFSRTLSPRSSAFSDTTLRLYFYGGGDILSLDLSLGWLSFTYYPADYPSRPEQAWFCSIEGHEELMEELRAYIEAHGEYSE